MGVFSVCIFLFFSMRNYQTFESLEQVIYGIEMRMDSLRKPGGSKISIVNIDEKSLKQLGPWPWPRHLIADMITLLKKNGAKVVGLDLLFSEEAHSQGLLEIQKLLDEIHARNEDPAKNLWLMSRLVEIEKKLDEDRVLAKTLKSSDITILPVLGDFGRYNTKLVLPQGSIIQKNAPKITTGRSKMIPVSKLKMPFSQLLENSRGIGHINTFPEKHREGQIHPLFVDYRGNLIPSLPLRMIVDYQDNLPEDVVVEGNGVKMAGHFIPALNGKFFIKYKGGSRSFPYYSFSDILKVENVPAVFKNRIVLIGYTAENTFTVKTPVDNQMPRIELMANVIENLMTGQYVRRPRTTALFESLALFIFTLSSAYFLPRLSTLDHFGLTAGFIFLSILIGVISFMALDIWFKSVYIVLSLTTVFVVALLKNFVVSQRALNLSSRDSIETNRMLGLSLQSQGLFDLAFEKFRKCPLDDVMMDVIYNLGLDYERKRMIHKAISVYAHLLKKNKRYRDLSDRIQKLKKLMSPLSIVGKGGKREEKLFLSNDLDVKPTVGRYEIIKEVGQGAMGIVYLAKDPKLHRFLAIKTIRFSDEFEENRINQIKARFFREAEIAGKLSHRSIVSIYDVGEDYDLTYMVMEYLEGKNLLKYCRKGSLLPLRKILYVVGETAKALNYAHSRGVIHRDIKPGNIMLLKDGNIKVTDFGIAKAVSSSGTKSGIILGTPNYMSPEQINGQDIDGRSDVFSLGVVLFELLTGQLPFHGKTLTNLFYKITQVKHPSPREINPNIPKPCEQILDKALAKNPNYRFQRADEFAKYVRALINKFDQAKKQQ